MSDEPTLEVPISRIKRLVDVLSLLSLGEYDPQVVRIVIGEDKDEMAFLEQSVNIFVEELVETHEENAAQFTQLEHSKAQLELRLETIERQRLAIRDLSSPIIELWDEIVTLPIIGLVDTQRSLEMTEQLLERISSGGYRCVIVDVTGVDVIDTMTADHFVKMIRAAQLLGAYCVITGLSPTISQTIVGIGVDLGGIRTLRSLKEGLRHCIAHLAGARAA